MTTTEQLERDRAAVLRVYPDAVCFDDPGPLDSRHEQWIVFSSSAGVNGENLGGHRDTEADAWADAARRLATPNHPGA